MIGNQIALIKREIWEHRSIYVAPIAVAIVISLVSLAGFVTVSSFDKDIHLALFSAANLAGDTERQAALTAFFLGTSWVFLVQLSILVVFYALDSLYAERKDKSILFWRSLPITDAETVISKLLTALLVLPLATVAVVIATHLVNLVITSVWIWVQGGNAIHMVWGSVALIDNWLAALIFTLASSLWISPFIGWFLFVSAFTKRAPLLMAFMPLVLIPIIEWIFFRSKIFLSAILERGDLNPLLRGSNLEKLIEDDKLKVSEEAVRLLTHLDIAEFLGTPSLWAGLVVCGLFTAAAIYVRRYRDES